jgi:hypothetical protein
MGHGLENQTGVQEHMSGFTEKRSHGASERPGQEERILTWGASAAMLPLVGRISSDLIRLHQQLSQLIPEEARLERLRRTLAWPERARRYALHEEIKVVHADLRGAYGELEGLGVTVLDEATGLVGFPTMVNDRKAFFSWQPGEDVLAYWNYATDSIRRPVPEAWTQPIREKAPRPRSRKGKK